jgi:hypothetical protein
MYPIIRTVAYMWLGTTLISVLAAYYLIWWEVGFEAMVARLSPRHILYVIGIALAFAPGLFLLRWANARKGRR